MQPDDSLSGHNSRIIVASGMRGTGCSTISQAFSDLIFASDVVDAGSVWSKTIKLCTAPFNRLILISTPDGISISSSYALVKLVRDHIPAAVIDLVINKSGEREAVKSFERMQHATTKFLDTKVNFGGYIPFDETLNNTFIPAVDEIADRIDNEIRFGCFIGY